MVDWWCCHKYRGKSSCRSPMCRERHVRALWSGSMQKNRCHGMDIDKTARDREPPWHHISQWGMKIWDKGGLSSHKHWKSHSETVSGDLRWVVESQWSAMPYSYFIRFFPDNALGGPRRKTVAFLQLVLMPDASWNGSPKLISTPFVATCSHCMNMAVNFHVLLKECFLCFGTKFGQELADYWSYPSNWKKKFLQDQSCTGWVRESCWTSRSMESDFLLRQLPIHPWSTTWLSKTLSEESKVYELWMAPKKSL